MTQDQKTFQDFVDLSIENLKLKDLVRDALPEMFSYGVQDENNDKTQFFATWIRKAQELTK